MKKFENLEACCDGELKPEKLARFQVAMQEYAEFMYGLNALLAPPTTNTVQ
jgi:hypothetical protein